MASLTRLANGRFRLQFLSLGGKRGSIRSGKLSEAAAKRLKHHVELILERTRRSEPFDPDTKTWLETIDDDLHAKVAAAGLVTSREKPANDNTLAWLLDYYFEKRTDAKPGTRIVWGQAKRLLFEFFGEDKPIDAITEGDADEWRSFLKAKLAETTTRKRCCHAKQFFEHARKKGFIAKNPFAHLKTASKSNPTRYFFLSREHAEKVFDACPDANWRLLFALARYGGLRVPSEPALLKWEDVSWEHSRITITSPKTEHHEGGESRIIPLFPELRPYLEDRMELDPESVYVLPASIRFHTNPGTILKKILKRAGLQPWPKLWNNLRSTRQTELSEQFPAHVVCAWIGNTEDVAKAHYLQVTDDHFRRAIESGAKGGSLKSSQAVAMPEIARKAEEGTPPFFAKGRISRDGPHWDEGEFVPDGLEPSLPGCKLGVVAAGPRDRMFYIVDLPGVAPGSPACKADIFLLDHKPKFSKARHTACL